MDTLFNEETASPQGNTVSARSIGWVTAPAPFPTSERGHDSQRDRLNQPRGFEPGTSSFRGGRFAHCATWTHNSLSLAELLGAYLTRGIL